MLKFYSSYAQFVFSLKRLQYVDLVTKRGTFQKLNLSVPTDAMLYVANEFEKTGHNKYSSTIYNEQGVRLYLSETMTKHGLCHTYNLALPDEIYNMDLVSFDFYHEYFKPDFGAENRAVIPRKSKEIVSYDVVIYTNPSYHERLINGIYGVNFMYIHDPYELTTSATNPIPLHRNNNCVINVEPNLMAVDESLHDMEPYEYD